MSPNSKRTLATSFLAVGNQPIEWVNAYGDDLMSFIDSVEAPAYTFPIDELKAGRGKMLFESTCTKCHGTYSRGGETTYVSRVLDRELIGTDPNNSLLWTPDLRRKFADSWIGNYGKAGVETDPSGYVVPPLTGVWASAPYLHNGSVPTIQDMLLIERDASGAWVDAAQRPTYWKADFSAYDTLGVGLKTDTRKPNFARLSAYERRQWFDATQTAHGKSNAGHNGPRFFTFAPENRLLTAEEKGLILEYLKTL